MSRRTNNLCSKPAALNFICWAALLWFGGLTALADQSVALTWNPSADTNAVGYRIYYGGVSHVYTNSTLVGNVTNTVVTGLVEGTTYYFGATTVDVSGNESDLSNEAIYVIPALVTNLPPTNPPPVVVNPPPTLDPISNLTVNQNSGVQIITLSGITTGATNENQQLKITAATSNNALTSKLTVNYANPNTKGTLSFRLVPNATGTAVITVTVNDGAATNNLTTQSFTVTVVNPNLPKILQPLTNIVAVAGQTTTLRVIASCKSPLRYQWRFNGAALPTATGASLTLKNLNSKRAGSYSVLVSNSYGSTNSAATVLVYATPAAAAQAVAALATAAAATPAAALATATPPAAPTQTSFTHAKGTVSFVVSGTPGAQYVVQASSDLVHWTAVETNTAPFTFVDTAAADFSQRFYRSHSQP
jgi:hypothetical protein